MWTVDGAELPSEVRQTRYPSMARVRQRFDRPRVDDIPATVAAQVAECGLRDRVRPGQTVAVAAGSRGIANIDTIMRAVVDAVRDVGGDPFVFPAMGSHGGATPAGQAAVLEQYGITAESMGCPVKSTSDAVEVGRLDDGTPVYLDRHAHDGPRLRGHGHQRRARRRAAHGGRLEHVAREPGHGHDGPRRRARDRVQVAAHGQEQPQAAL
ncbi:MAG: hypothetical protein ABGY41_13105, partial [Candidatus Poribacteria bacterium]